MYLLATHLLMEDTITLEMGCPRISDFFPDDDILPDIEIKDFITLLFSVIIARKDAITKSHNENYAHTQK